MQEEKGTCCHKCGHVHVKGTSCPKPFLTGAKSCASKTNEGLKDENPCWDGYHPVGTKMKDGKEVPNCVPLEEDELFEGEFCPACLGEYIIQHWNSLQEGEYKGRKVSIGKPFLTPQGPKKRAVYVKNKKGNVIKVNFGDPNMRIKKSDPDRRRSFRARHKCDTAKDRTTARYWSCKFW